MTNLDDILADDHAELDAMMSNALAMVETKDHIYIYDKIDRFWARLAMHIRAEHLHIFPALLKTLDLADNGKPVENLIGDLKKDHDFFMRELADIIKFLRKMDVGDKNGLRQVKKRLVSIAERLAAHNESEEKTIYPAAAQLGSTHLIAMVDKELKNMPPRFASVK